MLNRTTRSILCATALVAGTAGASQAAEIEFWHAMSGRLGEIIDQLVADFNESQDEHVVTAIHRGSYDDVINAGIAAYRARRAPAIMQVYERGFLTMYHSGATVPVGDLMAEAGYEVDWSDILPPVASFYIADGQVQTMPFNSSTPIFWFNRDHFEAAGIEEPATTWDEYDQQIRQIVESGASDCGLSLPGDYFWSMIENYSAINDMPYATQANGFDGLDTELVFNTTGVVGQVERMKSWLDDGVMTIAGQGQHPEQLFISGQCSTIFASTAAHAGVEAGAEFNWDATYMPAEADVPEPRNSVIGGASLWVLQGQSDAQYDAVAAFFDYLAEPEVQVWWHQQTGYVPITRSAHELALEQGYYEETPTREIAILQLSRGEPTDNSRGFRFGNHTQVTFMLREEIEAMLIGEKTVQEALDAAVARGNDILRRYERTHAAAN